MKENKEFEFIQSLFNRQNIDFKKVDASSGKSDHGQKAVEIKDRVSEYSPALTLRFDGQASDLVQNLVRVVDMLDAANLIDLSLGYEAYVKTEPRQAFVDSLLYRMKIYDVVSVQAKEVAQDQSLLDYGSKVVHSACDFSKRLQLCRNEAETYMTMKDLPLSEDAIETLLLHDITVKEYTDPPYKLDPGKNTSFILNPAIPGMTRFGCVIETDGTEQDFAQEIYDLGSFSNLFEMYITEMDDLEKYDVSLDELYDDLVKFMNSLCKCRDILIRKLSDD